MNHFSKARFVFRLLMALVLLCHLGAPRRAMALSYEEERELGEEVYTYIQRHMKIITDETAQSYLDEIKRKLLEVIGPQPFEYRLFILDNDLMNAFATPAGYIYVHSGLITAMESEGQLCSIVAHEMAHVTSRHVAERADKAAMVSLATLGGILAGILVGGPVGGAVAMGSMGGGVQAQLAFSRSDEREADRKGLNYLVQAGYSPMCMAEAFQIILRGNYEAPEGIPTYLTTHPGLTERIATVESMVKAHPGYKSVIWRGDQKTYQVIKNRVLALTADPQRARNYFQNMLQKDPNSSLGHYGLAMFYQKEQNYGRAIEEMQLALKDQPANAAFLIDLGELFFLKKDFSEAMNVLTRAVVLKPHSVQALYLLGRTYEQQGVEEEAQRLYERVLIQYGRHAQSLYHLGLIYGRKGDLARAHLHTGLYFQVTGQPEKAMFHLRQAQKNAADAPPEVQKRITDTMAEIKARFDKMKKKPAGIGFF